MRRDWLQFGLIAGLLLLLGVLAWLQYRWQGQISDAEQVRLEKRVADDARRFTSDFDGQIQKSIYFQDLSESGVFKDKGIRFVKRYLAWRSQVGYEGLFKGIFIIESESESVKKLSLDTRAFEEAEFPKDAAGIPKKIKTGPPSLARYGDYISVPVYESGESISEFVVTSSNSFRSIDREQHFGISKTLGHVVFQLDRKVLSEDLLKPLYTKYFATPDGAGFDAAVTDDKQNLVWSSNASGIENAEFSTPLFAMRPVDFMFFPRQKADDEKEPATATSRKRLVFSEVYKSEQTRVGDKGAIDIRVEPVKKDARGNLTIIEGVHTTMGLWNLRVRHESGSLQAFVANTRFRNLAVSFGILSILAVGMILIVVSARRARVFAQRQIDFVSSVSHEFRTPLSVIFSASENISDGVVEDPEKLRRYGGMIKKEGMKLSSMVEQILGFAGANARRQPLNKENVEIGAVVREVLDEYGNLFEEEGFEVEVNVPESEFTVFGDRSSITQAFRNLVANAVKYSNGNKWIEITVAKTGGKIAVRVNDRGIGIPSSEIKQIFEPFYRAREVVDEQISGNGLGLSLVKKIVDEHDGKIRVESEPGKGSRFEILFPATGG